MELKNIAATAKSLAVTFEQGDALIVRRVKLIGKVLRDNKVGDKGSPTTRSVLIALSDAVKLVAPAHSTGFSLSNLQHYAKVGRTIDGKGLATDAATILALYGTIYRGGAGAYDSIESALDNTPAAERDAKVVALAADFISAESDRVAAARKSAESDTNAVDKGDGVIIDLSDTPQTVSAFLQSLDDTITGSAWNAEELAQLAAGLETIATAITERITTPAAV